MQWSKLILFFLSSLHAKEFYIEPVVIDTIRPDGETLPPTIGSKRQPGAPKIQRLRFRHPKTKVKSKKNIVQPKVKCKICGQLGHYAKTCETRKKENNEKEEDKNKISLMTIHSSKGLEFKHVYLVGLEENAFLRSVQIYPNPSAGRLYIESELPFENAQLSDATGRTIHSFDLQAGVNQMHFPSLQSGTYFIRKDGQCVKWVVE